ncbi:MAG: NUDIX domain-containing protein [Clostridia bacterium]|nr:NUDIX domain-containing protein [Clostridia bacterium]
MGYIMDLRKAVGHRTLLQVGAGVIVEDERGRILLGLRSDNGCWGYAGGSVEPDEVVEEAAKRELLEETDLVAEDLSLFGVFSGPELHYVYPNGDEVANIDIVFVCRRYSGELNCSDGEFTKVAFFAPEELPENVSPPLRLPLDRWKNPPEKTVTKR